MAGNMDNKTKIVLAVVGSLGLLSAILGFSGEGTKINNPIQYRGWCYFPPNPAQGIGICAAIFLIIAQVTIAVVGGCCGCCKSRAIPSQTNRIIGIVCAVFSWITALIAFGLLVTGVSANQPGTRETIYGLCWVLMDGIFAGAGVLTLVATALGLSSYVLLRKLLDAAAAAAPVATAAPAAEPVAGTPVMAMGQPQFPQQTPPPGNGQTPPPNYGMFHPPPPTQGYVVHSPHQQFSPPVKGYEAHGPNQQFSPSAQGYGAHAANQYPPSAQGYVAQASNQHSPLSAQSYGAYTPNHHPSAPAQGYEAQASNQRPPPPAQGYEAHGRKQQSPLPDPGHGAPAPNYQHQPPRAQVYAAQAPNTQFDPSTVLDHGVRILRVSTLISDDGIVDESTFEDLPAHYQPSAPTENYIDPVGGYSENLKEV